MSNRLQPEITIILPCLNEEGSIGTCLANIKRIIAERRLDAEVVVVDNGSDDRSLEIIRSTQAGFPELRLIEEAARGYGNAYQAGLAAASGTYIFMADSDGTYDFAEIPLFIDKLRSGADMVIGNRFSGGMAARAMPWHHRWIGNPLLSFLVRFFFRVRIHDIHCGARALSRPVLDIISFRAGGMEFASEMIVKAAQAGLVLAEIPITYRTRIGISKLRSMRDGWRHLRFILLYAPLVLFLSPGVVLLTIGATSMAALYATNLHIFHIELFVHPMFISSLLIITGYQLITFAFFAKIYALTHLGDRSDFFERLFAWFTLEKALIAAGAITFIGAALFISIFVNWVRSGFGELDAIKGSIMALTLIVVGVQTCFSAFMLSTLGIKES